MSKANEARLNNLFQTMSTELDNYANREDFAINRLSMRMRKRAKYIRPDLESEGFAKFLRINEVVGKTEIKLDPQIVANAKMFLESILWRFNTRLDSNNIQESLDRTYLESLWRFGPGASNEVKGTHTAEKIYQEMTCTTSAEPLVATLRSNNFYFSALDAKKGVRGTRVVRGSKLTTVPKNEDSVRIIAIEPSGNMALQLAAGQYLTDVLRSIGLDISTQQDKNKHLAYVGSLDNSLATIDLSSASDMFTPELIRLIFPPKWYNLLMQIRSSCTTIKGVEHTLNMISTMGNGFTFPLMTLTIVCLIYAMRAVRNGPNLYVSWAKTAVFGDDIILPTTEYEAFCSILSEAGLVVNHDKSFSDGPFRESCGGDYWLGRDVTPFYVRSLLTDPEVYVAINQLTLWCSKHDVFMPKTLKLLASFIQTELYFVPEWSNPDQGILTAEVAPRYKFLQPKAELVQLKDLDFAMMLAVGGYLQSVGSDMFFTPRRFKTRYVVRKGRIPKGFLSGRSPIHRTTAQSLRISLLLFGLTASL